MKKKIININNKEANTSAESTDHSDEQISARAEENSIEEFIKIKKLQNQILEKMLNKITQPVPVEKGKNQKNK